MKKILIIGAHGRIARVATDLFLQRSDVALTLFLRDARRLEGLRSPRVRIVEGDATRHVNLVAAMVGQDAVYANLDGALALQARCIVEAMETAGLTRLVFVSSMGIYGEVPGQHYRSILDPYRDAAQIIEASGLDYTLLRPAWLDDRDVVRYGITQKGEPFENASATVSRRSVADLVVRLAVTPQMESRRSLGVHGAS